MVTPWTVARQAPLPMGFPRQEYWSGLAFPPPEDLPNPGIKPVSPACIFLLLPLALLPFTVKECAQDDHHPFSLAPKMRDMNPTPSLDLNDLQNCSEKNLLFYPLGVTGDTVSLQ